MCRWLCSGSGDSRDWYVKYKISGSKEKKILLQSCLLTAKLESQKMLAAGLAHLTSPPGTLHECFTHCG